MFASCSPSPVISVQRRIPLHLLIIVSVSVSDTHERMQRMVLRDLDPVVPRRSRSAHSVREPPPPYRLSPDDPRPPSGEALSTAQLELRFCLQ